MNSVRPMQMAKYWTAMVVQRLLPKLLHRCRDIRKVALVVTQCARLGNICLVRRVSRRKSVYRFRIGQIFEIYQRSGPSLLDIWHSVPDPVVVKC